MIWRPYLPDPRPACKWDPNDPEPSRCKHYEIPATSAQTFAFRPASSDDGRAEESVAPIVLSPTSCRWILPGPRPMDWEAKTATTQCSSMNSSTRPDTRAASTGRRPATTRAREHPGRRNRPRCPTNRSNRTRVPRRSRRLARARPRTLSTRPEGGGVGSGLDPRRVNQVSERHDSVKELCSSMSAAS